MLIKQTKLIGKSQNEIIRLNKIRLIKKKSNKMIILIQFRIKSSRF